MGHAGNAFRLVPLIRLSAVVLALVALVLIPFVIWGQQMDVAVEQLVRDQPTKLALALIGIAFLILDVVLPVPSSVVSISLCLLLGPAWGVPVVFIGMVGAFALGYFVGLQLPAALLREWVGSQAWDSLRTRQQSASMTCIAISRPVPVLAEVTALLAGSLRLPFYTSLATASASSLAVAAAYGSAAWLGLSLANFSTTALVICAASLPVASWLVYRWMKRLKPDKVADGD